MHDYHIPQSVAATYFLAHGDGNSSSSSAKRFPPPATKETGLMPGRSWMKKAITTTSLPISQATLHKKEENSLADVYFKTYRQYPLISCSTGESIIVLLSIFLWRSKDLRYCMDSNTLFISTKARYRIQ